MYYKVLTENNIDEFLADFERFAKLGGYVFLNFHKKTVAYKPNDSYCYGDVPATMFEFVAFCKNFSLESVVSFKEFKKVIDFYGVNKNNRRYLIVESVDLFTFNKLVRSKGGNFHDKIDALINKELTNNKRYSISKNDYEMLQSFKSFLQWFK